MDAPAVSRHHQASKHTTKEYRIRPILAAMLPAPCVECGQLVTPDQAWQVAHIVPAAMGGDTTLDNCRPAHRSCNARAGAQLGNALARKARDDAGGIRQW
jgi:5-methylcytosine-specific restriction endonuclease McrA